METRIYLQVPYAQKDQVKGLGARWDGQLKKWYFQGPVKRLAQFGPWIAQGREETLIAYEALYPVSYTHLDVYKRQGHGYFGFSHLCAAPNRQR